MRTLTAAVRVNSTFRTNESCWKQDGAERVEARACKLAGVPPDTCLLLQPVLTACVLEGAHLTFAGQVKQLTHLCLAACAAPARKHSHSVRMPDRLVGQR